MCLAGGKHSFMGKRWSTNDKLVQVVALCFSLSLTLSLFGGTGL
jgi:hypothetical protein